MRILLDVDGVLADTGAHAKSLLGDNYDPKVYDFGVGRLPAALQKCFWTAFGAPGACADIYFYAPASEFVRDLREIGHDVLFVTTPFHTSSTWVHERQQWLCKYFGASPRDIIHTSHKELVRGDVFIDDKPENVGAWQEMNPDGLAILFAQPYSTVAVCTCRCGDYQTILNLVEAHANRG